MEKVKVQVWLACCQRSGKPVSWAEEEEEEEKATLMLSGASIQRRWQVTGLEGRQGRKEGERERKARIGKSQAPRNSAFSCERAWILFAKTFTSRRMRRRRASERARERERARWVKMGRHNTSVRAEKARWYLLGDSAIDWVEKDGSA